MIETKVMSNRFIGDGNNKTFAFSFKFNNKNDIQVWLYDSTTNTLTQRTDFSLTPNDDTMPSDGGTVTFPSEGSAISSTQMVIVQRHMNLFQLDVYKHGMFLDLDNFERSLDTLVLEIQQVADSADRAIKYPINQTGFDPTLPTLKDGQTIMVNDDENGWTVIDVKELFDQTHSAWVAADNAAASASTAQKWAESEESPDNQQDEDSDTGKTMSSKSWALESREQALLATGQADLAQAWAQGESSPDEENDEESATGKTQSSRNWALYAKTWAQGEVSPDNKPDENSATGYTQSAKEWSGLSKDWAMSDESPDNKGDSDSDTDKTMSSKSWALHSRERAAAALTSEQNAAKSETNAAKSEQNAAESETNAAKSEQNAAESETNAAYSAELADAWAQGTSSPDGNTDTASPTGQTMSARSWVNYVKTLIGETGTTPFTGASETTNGEQGLVPAPLAGQQDHVLKGDGTWGELDIADGTANGLAPIISTIAPDENKSSISYLSPSSGEAEWDNLPYLTSEQDGVVKHYVGSSPSNMYLNANGIFSEIPIFDGATSLEDGSAGKVPQPKAGQQNMFLSGGGKFQSAVTKVNDKYYPDDTGNISLPFILESDKDSFVQTSGEQNIGGKKKFTDLWLLSDNTTTEGGELFFFAPNNPTSVYVGFDLFKRDTNYYMRFIDYNLTGGGTLVPFQFNLNSGDINTTKGITEQRTSYGFGSTYKYIRYASGLQLCWFTLLTTSDNQTITLPVSFTEATAIISDVGAASGTGLFRLGAQVTSGNTLRLSNTAGNGVSVIVIGYV